MGVIIQLVVTAIGSVGFYSFHEFYVHVYSDKEGQRN